MHFCRNALAVPRAARDVVMNSLLEFAEAPALLRTETRARDALEIQWRRRLGVYGVFNFKTKRVFALVFFVT